MKSQSVFKDRLQKHLMGGEAFMPVDEMLKKIPFKRLGERPGNIPYSFYELFYHIQFTQQDILKYCLNPNYIAPEWPMDYWPKEQAPATGEAWSGLKSAFFEDRTRLMELTASKEIKLEDPVPSNDDHIILRELLLVIEHTAYHSGQLLIILRQLGLHS